MTASPRILVIGAGCSGLVTLKTLREEGLEAVCLEMGGDVGGLWVFGNSNGRGGAYRSLHINTSVGAMEFSDFPMRRDIGAFPHHRHMATYFRDYEKAFGLTEHIRFHSEVKHCQPRDGGGYRVTVLDRSSRKRRSLDFDAVVVANGHHFHPAFPDPYPASNFSGKTLHSNQYVDPTTPHDFRGEDVIVVGIGNSAVDIACELARSGARSVTLSVRRGAWVLPKFLLGKPIDEGTTIPQWIPGKLRRRLVTRSFELLHGKMSQFGLPEPDHLIGEAHPTVSSDLAPLVANGDIEVVGPIASCSGETVRFAEGTTRRASTIVFATGYDVSFPFFDARHVSAPENVLPLFLRTFHLEHRHVFFVGLLQTVGAVMPAAESQARIVAKHLAGSYNLPPTRVMRAEVDRHEASMKARFVPSRRHSMQVIPEHFLPAVAKEIRRGESRKRKDRGLPFPRPRTSTPR